MELVNLKTGTDSYQDESGETRTRDEYPWGLCITLNNDTLNKLKAQPQGIGTEVMITAKAVIRACLPEKLTMVLIAAPICRSLIWRSLLFPGM